MRRFQYKELESAQDIRILRLEPAADAKSPLTGSLVIGNLTKCPTYDALSYTWDPSSAEEVLPDDEIVLTGISACIQGNLSQASRRLRRVRNARCLWIDALCINQTDIAERNNQVRTMASIYLTADRTVAWLGEDSRESDGAFVLGLGAATYAAIGERMHDPSQYQGRFIVHQYCNLSIVSVSAMDAPELVERFFRRRYFHRRWVIQELYHGACIDVVCGRHRVPCEVLLSTFDILSYIPSVGYSTAALAIRPTQLLQQLRTGSWLGTTGTDNVIPSLCAFCDLGCSDARDRVIVLSSLWNSGVSAFDYAKTVEATYCSFATDLLLHATDGGQSRSSVLEQLILVAAYQAGTYSSLQRPILASWLPDWTKRLPEHHEQPRTGGTRWLCPSSEGRDLITKTNGLRLVVGILGWVSRMNGTTTLCRPRDSQEIELNILDPISIGVNWLACPQILVDVDHSRTLQKYCPSLQHGDFLAHPTNTALETGHCLATVLCCYSIGSQLHCRIIGHFPIDLFRSVSRLERTDYERRGTFIMMDELLDAAVPMELVID